MMKQEKLALNWCKIPVNSVRFHYKVCESGEVIKTSKKHFIESKVTPYYKRGKMSVKIAGKEYCVKHLVAQAFIQAYRKGCSVVLIDGNPRNCHRTNLLIFSKQDLGRLTGGEGNRKPVSANGVEYYSVRDCAKALNCSYQTVLDYMSGKSRHSVLSGVQINYI